VVQEVADCAAIPLILSKAGWSWGCVSTLDFDGRTIFVADAHRDDGKRLVVRADERLMAFVELESAIQPAILRSKPLRKRATGEGMWHIRFERPKKVARVR